MIALLALQSALAGLATDLEVLCGEAPLEGRPLVSRSIHHPDVHRARSYLVARLEALGAYEVRTDRFTAEDVDAYNVIATLAGSDPDLAPLVVGAHYDSTGHYDEDWVASEDPAPGCDDDASGVAAVLALADTLAGIEPERTVLLALFSAEEVGLVGSAHLADQLDDVHLMLSLDPLGYNAADQDRLFVVFDGRWPEPADRLAEADVPFEVLTVDRDLIGGGERSDHASFWARGFPALHLATFPQPSEYHTMDDRLALVDQELLAQITLHLTAFVQDEIGEAPRRRGCDHVGGGSLGALLVLVLYAFRRQVGGAMADPGCVAALRDQAERPRLD